MICKNCLEALVFLHLLKQKIIRYHLKHLFKKQKKNLLTREIWPPSIFFFDWIPPITIFFFLHRQINSGHKFPLNFSKNFFLEKISRDIFNRKKTIFGGAFWKKGNKNVGWWIGDVWCPNPPWDKKRSLSTDYTIRKRAYLVKCW